jgi:hypothetical protein
MAENKFTCAFDPHANGRNPKHVRWLCSHCNRVGTRVHAGHQPKHDKFELTPPLSVEQFGQQEDMQFRQEEQDV